MLRRRIGTYVVGTILLALVGVGLEGGSSHKVSDNFEHL